MNIAPPPSTRISSNKHIWHKVHKPTLLKLFGDKMCCLQFLGLRGMRWRENGGSCTMRNFIICTHPQISLGRSSQGEWGGQGMWHAWERRDVYKVLVGKPEGKRPLERPKRRREEGVRMDLMEIGLGGCGLDSTGSGQGLVEGCCECG
jgi:hypothetical protein